MAGRRGITPADLDGGEDEGENTRPDRGQGRGGNAPPFPEGQAPEVAADEDEGHVQGPTARWSDPMAGRAKAQVDRSVQTSELIARRTMHARAKVKPTAP